MDDRTQGARWNLRDATREAHDAVDAAFSRHDLTTLSGYRDFLNAQARAFIAVERALDAAGAGAVLDDWSDRRRADDLLADLADLGAPAPPALDAPALTSPADVLGAVYVLEGSRLGGAMLSRRVPAEAPARFLASGGMGPRWRDLTALLDARLSDPADLDAAVRSARSVFHCFQIAADQAA